MVALPARPSPMAAPIAPPPRAIPNASMAAAKWSIYPSSVRMLGLDSLARETEIDDGQEHEDQRLDQTDEPHVEQLPQGEKDRSQQPRPDARDAAQDQDDHVAPSAGRRRCCRKAASRVSAA